MKQPIPRLSACRAIIRTGIFSPSKTWKNVVAGVVLSAIIALKVTGQAVLPSFVDIQNPGVTDYIIPNNVVNLYVTVAGAQGGNSYNCNYFHGGAGAILSGQIPVSNCSNTRIAPGGILRLIVGKQGTTIPSNVPNVGGAGGGGGSAILYKSPLAADWTILMVSGGGGGAAFSSTTNDPCLGGDGRNANYASWGFDGMGGGGAGGTNGNGGYDAEQFSYGGGGAFSDGVTSGNQGCTGKKGLPNGGAQSSCNALFTYSGGFGFGSGGAGISAGGGGGGGYSGGGGGTRFSGGGGGGSYFNTNWATGRKDGSNTGGGKFGDGTISLVCANGTPTPGIGLESATLPGMEVAGCNLSQCVDFGYSINETATTLSQFTAAGGKIIQGGCSVQSVTYKDVPEAGAVPKQVTRTYTVTDGGGNKASCTQVITIKSPSLFADISPLSQAVCINTTPATITASAESQFGLSVQWFEGENTVFSNATVIPGANSLSYKPPAKSIAGITYYFARITDGCGTIATKRSSVRVELQPITWYKDADNDNYYDPAGTTVACKSPGPTYKSVGLLGTDCNDNDNKIHPGASELCDGVDNDCNGIADDFCCPDGKIVYVNKDATGSNKGNNWANAFTKLQDAIELVNHCSSITQIWVAKGTYYPDEGGGKTNNDRTAAFVLKNNIAIYGGFNGTETYLTPRSPAKNPTILSGDIDQNDVPGVATGSLLTHASRAGNSYHVIKNNYSSGSTLDATAVLDGFIIMAGNANGGVAPDNAGGGIYNNFASPTISNCIFKENTAVANGGGLANYAGSAGQVINALFYRNAAQNGGGLFNSGSSPNWINLTVANNPGNGGIYNFSSSFPTITNGIVWGNGISSTPSSTPTVTYSTVEGGHAGTGNLSSNPLFVASADNNYRLTECSPAINTGNNAANPMQLDLDGTSRIVFLDKIDMGAYERVLSTSILFVDAAATGKGDGSSWENAYTSLTPALNDFNGCTGTIYLAEGTYNNQGQSISLNKLNGVILGGYPSGGGIRDPQANITKIRGNVEVLKSLRIDGVTIETLSDN